MRICTNSKGSIRYVSAGNAFTYQLGKPVQIPDVTKRNVFFSSLLIIFVVGSVN